MSQQKFIEDLNAALNGIVAQRFLKQGGQGAVFLADRGGSAVALKLFGPMDDVERLERELKLLQGMNHPNVVSVVENGTITFRGHNVPYICYEFIDGGDLTSLFASTVDYSDLRAIGTDVAKAIEALWDLRIVHRDVKPGNILQRGGGTYVLADVGLARHLDRNTITADAAVLGTPGYMSPEQAVGSKALTIRADVFSLGVTLYALASGAMPWTSQPDVGRTKPAALNTVRSDLPAEFYDLVDKMLSASASQRPGRLSEAFAALPEAT